MVHKGFQMQAEACLYLNNERVALGRIVKPGGRLYPPIGVLYIFRQTKCYCAELQTKPKFYYHELKRSN